MGRPARKYVRRVQTLLTEQQYEIIREYAQKVRKPVSAVVRQAVEDALIVDLEQHRKKRALERLCAGDAPVDDWPVMEQEIEQRWEACGHG